MAAPHALPLHAAAPGQSFSAPRMIAGDRRLCTAIGVAFGEQITAKTGAEGVYAASFHEFGLGAMVKAPLPGRCWLLCGATFAPKNQCG